MATSVFEQTSPGTPRPLLPTAALVALLCALTTVATVVSQDILLSRDVFHRLYDAQVDSTRVDIIFDMMARWRRLGYVIAPLTALLRIVGVACAFQLAFLVLEGTEVRLGQLIRVAALGYAVVLAGVFSRLAWLAHLRDSLVLEDFGVVPDSLAAVLYSPGEVNQFAYVALSTLNVTELAWLFYVTLWLLPFTHRRTMRAAKIVGTTWLVVTLARVGLAFLGAQLAG